VSAPLPDVDAPDPASVPAPGGAPGAGSLAANEARVAELLDRRWQLLVGGELTGAGSGRDFAVTSPYSETEIARVPDGDAADVERAVAAAAGAAGEWRATTATDRAELLRQLADRVLEHGDDLALLDAVDGGAPINVMAGDVRAAAGFLRYFAGLALEMKGETVPASANLHYTERQPYGVVAKIVPFNHPALFAISKVAAPLTAGNTVVLKPAEATPLSALAFGEIAREVLPPGVLNVVVGDGPAVPRALVAHPLVRRIGFTGSEQVGRSIQRDAAATDVKDVTLELGGKNALLAFPDADPAEVAAGAIRGMNFTWSGQSCGSTSRLLVHESLAEAVVAELQAQLAGHVIGNPLDPASHQGTIVNARQHARILEHIGTALAEGARAVVGGGRPAHLDRGLFVAPTVLVDVRPDARIAHEEVFGPVLSVISWRDEHEAIAVANSVRYGLTASIYTNDLRRAHRVARELDAGYVWVNGASAHFMGMPYGGFKASGVGREESLDELLSYTQVKAVNVLL
jgi:2-formylbenzoate dehydrogenase